MEDQALESQQRALSFSQSDLRLRILQILSKQNAYASNQEVLLFMLREQGHAIGRDKLHIELSWLEQIANVLACRVTGDRYVATLTNNGLEVVEGVLTIPGIRKPKPNEIQLL